MVRSSWVLVLSIVCASAESNRGVRGVTNCDLSHTISGDCAEFDEEDFSDDEVASASVSLLQISQSQTSKDPPTPFSQFRSKIADAVKEYWSIPDQSTPVVHVVYASTMNSTGPGDFGLMASMVSLSRNLRDPGNAVIHLITPARDMEKAKKFAAKFESHFGATDPLGGHFGVPHPRLVLHEEKPLPFDPGHNSHTAWLSGMTLTFSRWLLPQYLPKVKRVIYIDTDTLVKADVRWLYEMDMEGSALMLKPYSSFPCNWTEEEERSTTDYRLGWHYARDNITVPVDVNNSRILSAGVMLADLDRWREIQFTNALINRAESFKAQNMSIDDQCCLNVVSRQMNVVKEMPARYNVEGAGDQFTCDPVCMDTEFNVDSIFHFSGEHKQWKLLDIKAMMPDNKCDAIDWVYPLHTPVY